MKVSNTLLQNLRQDYKTASLNEKDVSDNPFKQFEKWFNDALEAQIYEPNAMTLATATKNGIPNARIVLLKGFDKNSFQFYTNYLSEKGKELKKNPLACLVFFWPELARQIRIHGPIEKLDKPTSETYFHSRPTGSQISAIVSPQSQVIHSRELLEKQVNELTAKYQDKTIPKPAHWGGFALKPTQIEFWQGRSNRLHDRMKYELKAGIWQISRLAP